MQHETFKHLLTQRSENETKTNIKYKKKLSTQGKKKREGKKKLRVERKISKCM